MPLELTIVVPAFNEAHRLAEGVKRFDAAVSDGAVDVGRTEVLVIDDGSTDGTAETARALLTHLPHHRVISLPANRGKGAAVRTGVTHARGHYTAYMDADMAIDPRAIPRLIHGLGTHDLAIGSRALPDSMVESTYVIRSVMGRLFNRLVTTGTGLGLHDTQCGFKAFHTPVARLLFHLVRMDRFAFDVEMLERAQRRLLHLRLINGGQLGDGRLGVFIAEGNTRGMHRSYRRSPCAPGRRTGPGTSPTGYAPWWPRPPGTCPCRWWSTARR